MQKIDYARIIAEKISRQGSSPQATEERATDIAKCYSLPLLRAWVAAYVAVSVEERQTASEAMRAEERSSLLGPAPRARLRAEVTGILRRYRGQAERGE